MKNRLKQELSATSQGTGFRAAWNQAWWEITFLQNVLASAENRVSVRSSRLSVSTDSESRCGEEHQTLRMQRRAA
jgi:hypothetical protein